MINSMTGFGRGCAENEMMRITIEMKTVNHRYLDFNIKMPRKLAAFEEDIKRRIKENLTRGRVELYIQLDTTGVSDFKIVPNFGVLDQYHQALSEIAEHYQLNDKLSSVHLTRFQDTLDIRTEELDEVSTRQLVLEALESALDSLMTMRKNEGESLKCDIEEQLEQMKKVLSNVEKRAPEIVAEHKENMIKRITELLSGVDIDENRILLEVAVFADKTDISEEIVRLKTHIEQVYIILNEDEAKGRKLDFLIQEMNREVNTIGSKSPDVDMSNDVVTLKSTLEKIREQVQNIE